MLMNMNEIFNTYWGIIKDERDQYTLKHNLIDILKLVMISVLCGMDELDKIVELTLLIVLMKMVL